jgi:hypothetical protein
MSINPIMCLKDQAHSFGINNLLFGYMMKPMSMSIYYEVMKPPSRSRHSTNTVDLESAHSSSIGVLLLISIVMVIGGIVSLVLTSQPMPDKVPGA